MFSDKPFKIEFIWFINMTLILDILFLEKS